MPKWPGNSARNSGANLGNSFRSKALAAEELRWRCNPELFDFISTSEITETFESLGQTRAEEALRFGVDIRKPGHNIFAMSDAGEGQRTTVEKILRAKADASDVPGDWCYINNFENPGKPLALALPAGRGQGLKEDMHQFVSELPGVISGAFESEEHRVRVEKIQNEFKRLHESALQKISEEATENGLAFVQGPQGVVFVPVKGNEVVSPEAFSKLTESEQKKIGQKTEEITDKFIKLSHQFPQWRRELQSKVREANRETMRLAVGHIIDEIRGNYRDLPAVTDYLDRVFAEVVKVGESLITRRKNEEDQSDAGTGNTPLQRFEVNVVVDRNGLRSAPVIYEDSPTYQNLLGRSDQMAYYGLLMTNFTLIRPGSLHRANGGYLLVDAEKLLAQPFAYEGLKRALKSQKIKIESPLQLGGLTSTVSLEPEPIPLDVKVILSGHRRIYYLLLEFDPEFKELFRVIADFESDTVRSDETVKKYAGFVAHLVTENGLRPFTREAVARLIEYGARASGDAEKLSVNARVLSDLMTEADHMALAAGKACVDADHIEQALTAQISRADRVRRALEREVMRETLLIATAGAEIGQVNGLALLQSAVFAFAQPMRITANVWLGKGNIIDIEREAELGGKIHSKGVMILASYLASKFGAQRPLAIGASLVFEQSYNPVEGDSASLAELCALLSALAEVPVTQSLAVTGSVNQHGRVQAIGGVNEKIEGFFDLCNARGLTGRQGVLIPRANVKHLMLRSDVVKACASKKFQIYPADSVDEALELLTGLRAGKINGSSGYPAGSVHFLIARRLMQMEKATRPEGKKSR